MKEIIRGGLPWFLVHCWWCRWFYSQNQQHSHLEKQLLCTTYRAYLKLLISFPVSEFHGSQVFIVLPVIVFFCAAVDHSLLEVFQTTPFVTLKSHFYRKVLFLLEPINSDWTLAQFFCYHSCWLLSEVSQFRPPFFLSSSSSHHCFPFLWQVLRPSLRPPYLAVLWTKFFLPYIFLFQSLIFRTYR